jgi:hypothetical protein
MHKRWKKKNLRKRSSEMKSVGFLAAPFFFLSSQLGSFRPACCMELTFPQVIRGTVYAMVLEKGGNEDCG